MPTTTTPAMPGGATHPKPHALSAPPSATMMECRRAIWPTPGQLSGVGQTLSLDQPFTAGVKALWDVARQLHDLSFREELPGDWIEDSRETGSVLGIAAIVDGVLTIAPVARMRVVRRPL
jgi:hypothetical protein